MISHIRLNKHVISKRPYTANDHKTTNDCKSLYDLGIYTFVILWMVWVMRRWFCKGCISNINYEIECCRNVCWQNQWPLHNTSIINRELWECPFTCSKHKTPDHYIVIVTNVFHSLFRLERDSWKTHYNMRARECISCFKFMCYFAPRSQVQTFLASRRPVNAYCKHKQIEYNIQYLESTLLLMLY